MRHHQPSLVVPTGVAVASRFVLTVERLYCMGRMGCVRGMLSAAGPLHEHPVSAFLCSDRVQSVAVSEGRLIGQPRPEPVPEAVGALSAGCL